MPWERLLANIRDGKIPIGDLADNGIPYTINRAPYYELMQFVAALVCGYNRNFMKIKSLKNMVKKEMEE